MQQQDREQRPLPGAGEADEPSFLHHLERSQDPEVRRGHLVADRTARRYARVAGPERPERKLLLDAATRWPETPRGAMLKSPQFTRSALIAATVISLGASPAVAREADAPLHPRQIVTTVAPRTQQWTAARVDSIGVRPADQPVASPAPAVPLDRATPASGGPDWLLIAIGSTAMVALLLAVAVLPTRWLRGHPFRPRQV